MKFNYRLLKYVTLILVVFGPILSHAKGGDDDDDDGKDKTKKNVPHLKILNAEPNLIEGNLLISGKHFGNKKFKGTVKLFVPTLGNCKLDVLDYDPEVAVEKEQLIQELLVTLPEEIADLPGTYLLTVKRQLSKKEKEDQKGNKNSLLDVFYVTLSSRGTGDGATGPTGLEGVPGLPGLPGLDGVDGITGITGPTGLSPTGPQGPNGLPGFPGFPGFIQGAPGSQGPQGPPGGMGLPGTVQGPTGATGSDGSQGDTGNVGAQGSQGTTGETGPQGDAGPAGPVGLGNNCQTAIIISEDPLVAEETEHIDFGTGRSEVVQFIVKNSSNVTVDVDVEFINFQPDGPNGPHFKLDAFSEPLPKTLPPDGDAVLVLAFLCNLGVESGEFFNGFFIITIDGEPGECGPVFLSAICGP